MSKGNFVSCFQQTEVYEGWHKASNDRYDPGGDTYDGVTQATWNAYCAMMKLPRKRVELMTDAQCMDLYQKQFWDAVHGDDLPIGLDLVVYDIAVNSGPVTAIRFLQQSLGQKADGHFGLVTINALASCRDVDGLIRTICAKRASYWHALSTFWRYGKGWMSRGTDVEAKALKMRAAAPVAMT